MRNVTLILDDGSRFHGKSFGYEKPVAGEVVFNTAMTGYPESLTDPSYAGQLMTLTYPWLETTVYLLSLSQKTDFLILWKAKKFMPKRLS